MTDRSDTEGRRYVYGRGVSQYGQLWAKESSDPLPTVVLVHGGFWRSSYGLDLMVRLAEDLHGRGYAVWNIEYGRVGEDKGGWPHTLLDVGAAVDYLEVLADHQPVDPDRVAVVGHSAGGHLALWSGSRDLLAETAEGAGPVVTPRLVIGLGAVVDLYAGARDGLGNGAVVELLGGNPEEYPERYSVSQPRQSGSRIVLVNGELDDTVPLEYSMYGGIDSKPLVIDHVDHMALIDPNNESWSSVIAALAEL